MKIIISPAKKMNIDTDTAPWQALPAYLRQTRVLMEYMKSLDYDRCRAVWKCSERLARENFARLKTMDLERGLTPAVLSYEGIQYQHLAPRVMEEEQLSYLQGHLRILSGFYGMLKPFDGVTPYRLEMQAKLGAQKWNTLYEYWGDRLAEDLFREDSLVLNLASREYSRCIFDYHKRKEQGNFVTCVFGERQNGKIVEKGTLAKMARGEMVRYLAEMQAEDTEAVKRFQRLDYRFAEAYSDDKTLVFLKEQRGYKDEGEDI